MDPLKQDNIYFRPITDLNEDLFFRRISPQLDFRSMEEESDENNELIPLSESRPSSTSFPPSQQMDGSPVPFDRRRPSPPFFKRSLKDLTIAQNPINLKKLHLMIRQQQNEREVNSEELACKAAKMERQVEEKVSFEEAAMRHCSEASKHETTTAFFECNKPIKHHFS